MAQFTFGLIAGMLLLGTLTYLTPRNFIGVNNELIRAGMAYYHPITGEVIWKEPKEAK
jgi:hypothetical protein